jgi:hypothetical protein
MAKPLMSVAPPEEAPGAGGMTTASTTRATYSRMATMKKYNNPLATSVVQGIKTKIHSRPTFMMLPQLTSGRRSTKAVTRGLLLKRGEGTVPAGTTMMMTATASPPSPPASPTSPTQTSNQSEFSSTTISRTHASGFDATSLLLKFQGDPTPPKLSTSRWLWSPHPSCCLKGSSQTRSTHGRTSSRPSSITSWDP